MNMEGFTQRLPGVAAAYLNHPLMDFTGLKGTYDFSLHWTGRNAALSAKSGDADPPAAISVFEAVDKQLGLKIEARQQPTPVIVVDHVNQTPTDNAPGVTKTLPPAPTEFEVASFIPCGCSVSGCRRIRSTTLTTLIRSSGRCSRRMPVAASTSMV